MENISKVQCTRKIHFSAGHRVMGHEHKCATPHGHNYNVFITAEAPQLDAVGRVIDFSVLKDTIGAWIDSHWDHTFLVYEKDKETLEGLLKIPHVSPPFVCPFNPTAENIALYLLNTVAPELLKETNITVTKIVVQETENCSAEATLLPKPSEIASCL